MILFCLNTGLRKQEFVYLRWKDVNLNGGFITVQGHKESHEDKEYSFEPKDHEARRIKQNTTARKVLEGLKGKADITPWVFANKYGCPRQVDGRIDMDMKEILDMANVKDKGRWHGVRRTFAVNLLMRGADLESLRQLLGHSDISTTQKYLNVTGRHLNVTVDLLESNPESTFKNGKSGLVSS